MRARRLFWLTAAARGFVFVAMLAPVLLARDGPALIALLAVGAIWFVIQLGALRPELDNFFDATLEAALVGALCGLTLDAPLAVLAPLAVVPFVAGLQHGVRGVAVALSAQLIAIGVVSALSYGELSVDTSLGIFTWCLTGLGLGFVSTFVRSTALQDADELAPYLYAQSLIRQLIDISDGLSSGLDVHALGGAILSTVGDELPTAALALYVPRGEILSPLITTSTDEDADIDACEGLAVEAWARAESVVQADAFAFPLGDLAIVGGVLSARELQTIDLGMAVHKLEERLQTSAVHFDTALLFSNFRDAATADERRRLAREMHDGIAQDIASLGYLVDALAARPASPQQADQFAVLRERITLIVAEVRQSVLTLRTSVGEHQSLGVAIGSVARHLSEVSGVPIQVTLNERPTRLRPEVEAELFRITQEAINNAVKHAHASSIDVNCQVRAPAALITVTDDGRGLQKARNDSYGLKIMKERAKLIKADLTIDENPSGGLVVTVQIDSQARSHDHRSLPASESVMT
ncbi:MAG: histidine kinase [Nocardioides sp.]